MRYGIDLDGVICDFHKGFARTINKLFPGRVAPGAEHPDNWDWEGMLTSEERGKVWREITRTPNWWLSLPAIGHNVGAIFRHRLQFPEDEIFYVTARHHHTGMERSGLPEMHQSQKWIDMCGIGGLGTSVILMNGERKHWLYGELGVDGAVDDDPHHLPAKGGYLLATPWNSKERDGHVVIKGLDEFFERVGRKL